MDVLESSTFIGTKVGPFVKEYQLADSSMCRDLIEWAESQNAWEESKVFGFESSPGDINPEVRSSREISLSLMSEDELNESPILRFATDCVNEYIQDWTEAGLGIPCLWIREAPVILKYEKGEAYSKVHTDFSPVANSDRHLTFCLYLNTVSEGGELSFEYVPATVAPIEGKGVLFPSGWTHAHHTTPTSETRYVLQLWWSYQPSEDVLGGKL
jgi:hypothetical protein